jgi:hypothetical protein
VVKFVLVKEAFEVVAFKVVQALSFEVKVELIEVIVLASAFEVQSIEAVVLAFTFEVLALELVAFEVITLALELVPFEVVIQALGLGLIMRELIVELSQLLVLVPFV